MYMQERTYVCMYVPRMVSMNAGMVSSYDQFAWCSSSCPILSGIISLYWEMKNISFCRSALKSFSHAVTLFEWDAFAPMMLLHMGHHFSFDKKLGKELSIILVQLCIKILRILKRTYMIKKETTKYATSLHILRLDFFSNTILNRSMVPDNIPLDASMWLPIRSSKRLWLSTSSCISPVNLFRKTTLSCKLCTALSLSCSLMSREYEEEALRPPSSRPSKRADLEERCSLL